MKSVRTDLAVEAVEAFGERLPAGIRREQEEKDGVTIIRMEVPREAAETVGKPAGSYVTLEVDSFENSTAHYVTQVQAIAGEISRMLPETGTVLVAGLGNNDITPDALGPKTIDGLFATRHIPKEVAESTGLTGLRSTAAIAPGVLGQTGMETAEILASLVRQVCPAAVIVIDALASKSIERLGKTVQISNTGISPGSGVQNSRSEISLRSVGVPVVAVGIPTVVDMRTIAEELSDGAEISPRGESMMVTPREIDVLIDKSAKALSLAINSALQPTLSVEDISALIS